MQRRFLTTVWTLALVTATGLLPGCRSEPPVPAPPHSSNAWQPKSEDAKHRLEGFQAYMRRSYPRLGLESKEELWETALEYVQWLGMDVDSQAGNAQLEDTLSGLVVPPGQSNTRWLLKGTVHTGSRTRAPSESFFYGIAIMTRTNDALNVVLDSSRGRFDFHGAGQGEQVEGQLSFQSGGTGLAAKAAGTLAPGRLSLTVRGRSGKQTVQGEFVLLR